MSNLEEMADRLYAHIKAYKITRDEVELINIAILADAIKAEGYRPSYYKRDQGLVISRVETYNPSLQVIDNA
jgi:hypothetical protein